MQLQRFGGTTLPDKSAQVDYGSSLAATATIDTTGGTYDAQGGYRSPLTWAKIKYRCVVAETTATAADSVINTLKGMVGARRKLYRVMDDGSVHWANARCIHVSAVPRSGSTLLYDVEIDFRAEMPWYGKRHGPGWTLDSGEYLDSGLYLDESGGTWTMDLIHGMGTFTLQNDGNYPTTNIILTWDTPSADIQIFDGYPTSYPSPGSDSVTHITYTHTGTPTTSLVLDCAARRVQVDGVDDYSTFALGVYHRQPDWLRAEPGSTVYYVSGTGGGVMQAVWYDAWV